MFGELSTLDVIVFAVHTGCLALAFVAMARDKLAAMTGRWRTPELNLLALNLLPGGGFGILTAMLLLSHKSRKLSFWQASLPSTFAWLNGMRLLLSEDARSWVLNRVLEGVVYALHWRHFVAGMALSTGFCFLGWTLRLTGFNWTSKKRGHRKGVQNALFLPSPIVRRFLELLAPLTLSSFAVELLLVYGLENKLKL